MQDRPDGLSGLVRSVDITKHGPTSLDEEVVEKVKTWRYKPLMQEGRAVPFCVPLRVDLAAN